MLLICRWIISRLLWIPGNRHIYIRNISPVIVYIWIYIYIYICIYLCIYICIYLCIYLCILILNCWLNLGHLTSYSNRLVSKGYGKMSCRYKPAICILKKLSYSCILVVLGHAKWWFLIYMTVWNFTTSLWHYIYLHISANCPCCCCCCCNVASGAPPLAVRMALFGAQINGWRSWRFYGSKIHMGPMIWSWWKIKIQILRFVVHPTTLVSGL